MLKKCLVILSISFAIFVPVSIQAGIFVEITPPSVMVVDFAAHEAPTEGIEAGSFDIDEPSELHTAKPVAFSLVSRPATEKSAKAFSYSSRDKERPLMPPRPLTLS